MHRRDASIAMEIRDIGSFLEYYDKIRGRTNAVVQCIPREHLEWTVAEGRFTCGDIVRHLASIERYMYAENAVGRPSRYPGHGRQLAEGLDAVMSYFSQMHEESVAILARLTPDDLARRCVTPAGARITTWKWLRAMIEHEIHHRGQLYLYLGLLGVPVPQIFGLTSEQVREASASA